MKDLTKEDSFVGYLSNRFVQLSKELPSIIILPNKYSKKDFFEARETL